MKTISIRLFFTLTVLILISCNEEKKKEEKPATQTVETPVKRPMPNVMYVIAPSGLLLRAEDNLNSTQVAKMPYGASVNVLSRPDNASIEVANILGNMIQVRYNDMTGYAYNGYLTRFKVPQAKEKPEAYADRLKENFPEVSASSENGEKEDIPTTAAQLSIPAQSWSEAFLMAKQLFDIPAEYIFPGTSGPNNSSVQSHQEHVFSSTLNATRNENQLIKIEYIESAQGFSRTVSITKNGNLYTLEQRIKAD